MISFGVDLIPFYSDGSLSDQIKQSDENGIVHGAVDFYWMKVVDSIKTAHLACISVCNKLWERFGLFSQIKQNCFDLIAHLFWWD